MPIYEYFCPDCFTVFSFFSATSTVATRPACPRCGRPELERRPSRFATLKHAGKDAGGGDEADVDDPNDPFRGLDEGRLDRALESLSGEMEALGEGGEDDPRQMASFFRKFAAATGLEPGAKIEEMLGRLERGDDPESLDEDWGDDDESMAELFRQRKEATLRRLRRPAVDDTLYFL